MKTCIICSTTDSKYKCPICTNYYCSVKCCKDHKQELCSPPITQEEINREEMQFLTEDTVPEDKLKLLDDSKELKNLLNNPHLRNYIKELDNSPNPEQAINKAMLEPLFVEFADVCLQIIEPPDKETDIYNKVESNTLL